MDQSLDHSQQNEVNPLLKNHPAMAILPERTVVQELNDMLSVTINGIAVSGSAASGQIGPLISSFDISESDDGFLFCVALPGVEKDERFKCDIQADGTITIQGATNTGEKKVHSHNMVFEVHTQNLGPPGDFSVSFQLGAHVDPPTFEHVLDNGSLRGLLRRNRPVDVVVSW